MRVRLHCNLQLALADFANSAAGLVNSLGARAGALARPGATGHWGPAMGHARDGAVDPAGGVAVTTASAGIGKQAAKDSTSGAPSCLPPGTGPRVVARSRSGLCTSEAVPVLHVLGWLSCRRGLE